MSTRPARIFVLAASVTALITATTALNAYSSVLEEIVVTAQKRSENVQRVPLAVSAFTQERLDKIGADNIERLGALTPGLEWGQYGLGANVSIRGQSPANFEANTDSPVGFFVDGIYLGRGQQVWSVMTDVERVEVTRGPQGTLFGRNTSAGSINVVSNKPSREKEFNINLTLADYDQVGVSGYFNAPVSDNLAARLTFFTQEHDGYLENTFDIGEDFLDEDIQYVRGSLRYEEGALTVDLALDTWSQGGNGAAFSGVRFFDQDNPSINTWAGALSGITDIPAQTKDWEIEANDSYRDVDSVNTTLVVAYDLGEVTFKSITGSSSYEQLAGGESDFSTLELADLSLDTDATIFSQELQLSSNGGSDLDWIVGLYYLDEEIDELFRFFFTPAGYDFATRDGRATAESIAVYGQATYSVNENIRLTLGARYTEDKKAYRSTDVARADNRGNADTSATFDDTTWRVGLDYIIDDARMLYVNISTGFKSGGFNRYLPPSDGSLSYDLRFEPETLINYEVGYKADLLDETLRANVALYYNEIDDFQSYAFDNSLPSSITTNAASASTKGLELELTYVPDEKLEITVVGAFLDAVYDDYGEFSNGSLNIDASGNTRELSPEWKFTFAASYDFDLGDMGTLTPYLQTTYKGEYFVTAANNVDGLDKQDSYTQSDLRLIWGSANNHWRGELFVENIEDNFVKTGGFLATNGYWLTYGPQPRLFGAKLSYTY